MILALSLLIGHSLCDTALQSGTMANAKRRKAVIDRGFAPWWMWLTHHALIHSGVVLLVTGSVLCTILELISHWLIDFFKCEGKYGAEIDQLLHISMKIVYCLILWRI